MRPVRINLVSITEKKFVKMMMKYFPSVEETHEEWMAQFYAEMAERYIQVILDLDSGEVIQAFLPDGTWALSKYYLDIIPTPEMLTSDGFPKPEKNFDYVKGLKPKKVTKKEEQKDDEIVLDEKTIDKILDKISKSGKESLSDRENKMLELYVKKK